MLKVKNLKRALFITLALSLALGSILSGCAKAPASTIQAPIILRWSLPTPPAGPGWDLSVQKEKAIETRTGGRVDVQLFPSGSLATGPQTIDALRTGLIDISVVSTIYNPGLFPLTNFVCLPMICPGHPVGTNILQDLYPKYLQAEWDAVGVKVLYLTVFPSAQVFSKKPMQSLADFKGVTISCPSELASEGFKLAGFLPINIPGGNTYVALQKGVIDACSASVGGGQMMRYQDFVKYITILDFYVSPSAICMSSQSYNALPADIRKIVVEELIDYQKTWLDMLADEEVVSTQYFKTLGFEILRLPENEYELLKQQMAPLADTWIAEQEKAGRNDARQYVEDFYKLRDQYLTK